MSGTTARIARWLAAAIAVSMGTVGVAHAADKLTIIMSWVPDPQHGGFYQAQAMGLYKDRGLEVTIRPGGPQINSGQMLAAGSIDMRVASNGGSGLDYVQQNVPVVIVAANFQKDPQALIAHPGVGNDSLAAMKGKPIAIGQQAVTTWWPFLRARFGFTDQQIRPYTFNLAPFLVDKNAIQQGYAISEPYMIEKQAGFKPLVYLLADDAGYDAYAQTIEARASLVAEKPDVVQRFVDATMEGWYSYLYGDPTAANALIKAGNPDITEDGIANSIAKMKEYGIVDSGDTKRVGIGAMTDERWKTFFDAAVKAGLYPASLDYRKAYTLQFVNKKVGMK